MSDNDLACALQTTSPYNCNSARHKPGRPQQSELLGQIHCWRKSQQKRPCWCRPAYLALQSLREDFPGAPFLACTATATQRVKDSIIQSLGLKSPVILESSFNSMCSAV